MNELPIPALATLKRPVFFTGAGLSAECGLPTYRGAGGIWGEYDYEEYACQDAFNSTPEKVWTFHDERRRVMGAARPGLAHKIIALVAARNPSTCVVTQNIDGLHQRAGSPDVIELHGSVWRVRCRCAGSPRENLDNPLVEHTCPDCGAWRRPDIVWFGDPMPQEPLNRAIDVIMESDLFISIGTSGVVYPAAQLPRFALDGGGVAIEVNPEDTPVSGLYSMRMRGGAAEMLTQLWPDLAAEAAS